MKGKLGCSSDVKKQYTNAAVLGCTELFHTRVSVDKNHDSTQEAELETKWGDFEAFSARPNAFSSKEQHFTGCLLSA